MKILHLKFFFFLIYFFFKTNSNSKFLILCFILYVPLNLQKLQTSTCVTINLNWKKDLIIFLYNNLRNECLWYTVSWNVQVKPWYSKNIVKILLRSRRTESYWIIKFRNVNCSQKKKKSVYGVSIRLSKKNSTFYRWSVLAIHQIVTCLSSRTGG